MSNKSKHEMICKILDYTLSQMTYDELFQYAFDKEYDKTNKLTEDQILTKYTAYLVNLQRSKDGKAKS